MQGNNRPIKHHLTPVSILGQDWKMCLTDKSRIFITKFTKHQEAAEKPNKNPLNK